MENKKIISSYNETNDTLSGKIFGRNGYIADYEIDNEIFLSTDENNLPVSFQIDNASKTLGFTKEALKNPNIRVAISSDDLKIYFDVFLSSQMIFTSQFKNNFGFKLDEIWNSV